jgi:integrase
MRRFPLGRYPALGLSEARSAARLLHTRVKHYGEDPVAERRRERALGEAAKAGVGTLASILDLYGEKVGNQQRAWPASRKRIDFIFRELLSMPVGKLSLADFQITADNHPFPKSAAFAVRAIRPALKWAAQPGRKYIPSELTNLSTSVTVERRRRVLTPDELAQILPALRASDRPYAAALRFMLLTLARRQEAAHARWRDVNLEARTWTILATKNGEPHVVPLSRQALELLRSVLPKHDVGNLGRLDPNAPVFATSNGAALGDWDRETKVIQRASNTGGWTRHDLRRTGATMLGEMGVLPDIIEAALNHTSIRSPLAATYNRSRYRPQVAAALQRLAHALDGIEAGAGQVLPLRARVAEIDGAQ